MSFAAQIASERPTEVALRDWEKQLTWAEVDDVLNRAIHQLLDFPFRPERRVAVFAHNSTETILIHLAGLLAGTSIVPVNFHLTPDETAYILEDSGAELVFVGPENLAAGTDAATKAGDIPVIGWRCPAGGGHTAWEDWIASGNPAAPPTDHAPRPNLMYTSGTTGVPKGTELPPTMFHDSPTVAAFQERLRESPWCKYGQHLVVGPLYHTGPLGSVRILGGGVPVAVLDKFDPEQTLHAIEKFAVQSAVMVPTHFRRLHALPEEVRHRYDLSSLAMIYHTGASCPVELKAAMLDWWGPVIYEAYGATEVGTTCRIGPEEWRAHPGSVGKPNPPFRALVIDDDDNELPAGETGRLYFEDESGRGVVYHNDPEKSARAHLRPGVFTLGEIGHVDQDGYVYITDRFSDMIVSGGVNVYPAEAEAVLTAHPQVRDVACIGVPNKDMGEELLALVQAVQPTQPPGADELIAYCRENLSHYKCPRKIEFREDLGRNAMGKINKRLLRAPYWN